MALQWEKLSPAEFQQLQDLAAYSSKKLQDVLVEFCGSGPPYKHNPDGSEDADDLKKFQNMIDWKNCMKAGKVVTDDQLAIRQKYKKPVLEEIKKDIAPILKEIEKNKECAKSFPNLDKVDFYAELMFYFCGAMDVEEVKFQEGKNNVVCAKTFVVLPQLVEMTRRNVNAVKMCKVKEAFEKTFKKVLSNC